MLFWTLCCFATVGGEILQNWSAAPVKQQMERSSLKHGGHFEMHKLELWNYLGTFKTSWSPPHPTPHPPNWKQTCLCKGMVHGTFFGSFFFDRPFWSWQGTTACNFLNTGYYWMLECYSMMTNDTLDWILGQEQPQRSKRLWLKGVPGPWGPCSQRPVADKPWRPWTGRVLDARDRFGGIVGQDFDNPPCVRPVKSESRSG